MTDAPAPARLLLVRHGETEWSAARRHTGRTDLPLTEAGRAQARSLRGRVPIPPGARVWVSPLVRATETAALAGVSVDAVDPDLMEWDYGDVEGRTTDEVRSEHPAWTVWADGAPGGESIEEVAARAERVIARALELGGTTVLVAHAHLLRILTARWIELPAREGRRFTLDPAAWSSLSFERETRVVEHWNVDV
ncbi:MAG: histidine phosphatase family protein [Acidimicrobiales bacterium]|nr:histidine phosphatase family protein [Acidimicrobiales bacterium]